MHKIPYNKWKVPKVPNSHQHVSQKRYLKKVEKKKFERNILKSHTLERTNRVKNIIRATQATDRLGPTNQRNIDSTLRFISSSSLDIRKLFVFDRCCLFHLVGAPDRAGLEMFVLLRGRFCNLFQDTVLSFFFTTTINVTKIILKEI